MTFDDVELELSRRTGVGLKYAYGRSGFSSAGFRAARRQVSSAIDSVSAEGPAGRWMGAQQPKRTIFRERKPVFYNLEPPDA